MLPYNEQRLSSLAVSASVFMHNCFATLMRLNTRTVISGLIEARTSVGFIPLFVMESLMSFNITYSHDRLARNVISIAHFVNEILLCSKVNCEFDIYFPPACDVIWSLSKINLIDTNSIRFRVVTNARAKSKGLVLLEKRLFSNGNSRIKSHRFLC